MKADNTDSPNKNAVIAFGGSGETFDQLTASPFTPPATWTGAAKVDMSKEGWKSRLEEKHRIEDAIAATKAAVEEGIVPGGGVALIRAVKALEAVKAEGEEAIGVRIVAKAIEEPLRTIASNAGKDGSVVVEEVKKATGSKGYNAEADTYEDVIAAGIIDPAKVTRSALQNATSVAALFLTTECVITEKPKKEEPMPDHGHGGGMGF
jgi:chaperonin GroEL